MSVFFLSFVHSCRFPFLLAFVLACSEYRPHTHMYTLLTPYSTRGMDARGREEKKKKSANRDGKGRGTSQVFSSSATLKEKGENRDRSNVPLCVDKASFFTKTCFD